MVSSLLALMACAMLTPKTNHHANYIDPRERTTDQTYKDIEPGYDWFY